MRAEHARVPQFEPADKRALTQSFHRLSSHSAALQPLALGRLALRFSKKSSQKRQT